jgi:hypothetical protein
MKTDLPSSEPIVVESVHRRQQAPDVCSVADTQSYIVDMIDQLSLLAERSGEPLVGAMLAEVSRRAQALQRKS